MVEAGMRRGLVRLEAEEVTEVRAVGGGGGQEELRGSGGAGRVACIMGTSLWIRLGV